MYNNKKSAANVKTLIDALFKIKTSFPQPSKNRCCQEFSKLRKVCGGMSQEGFQLGPRTHENTLDPDAKDIGSDWEPPQKGKAAKRGRPKTSWSKIAHGKKKNPKVILGSTSFPKRRIGRPPSRRVLPGKLTVANSPFLFIFDET